MKHRLIDAPRKDTPAAPPDPAAFSFVAPVACFEDLSKSDENRQMRIAGVISTQSLDLQNERIIQHGLNFDDFLGERGFFNNDHRKGFLDILGYPERVEQFNPGESLPNGQVAKSHTTWCEGYLLDTDNGRATFELAKALVGTGRCLGFSVEGKVEERRGSSGQAIAKARIQHCAITHQPVNQDSRLEVLLRSLASSCTKGLALTSDGAAPANPGSVADGRNGSGMRLSREGLSRKVVSTASAEAGRKRRKRRKTARKSQVRPCLLESIYSEFPDLRPEAAIELVKSIQRTRAT